MIKYALALTVAACSPAMAQAPICYGMQDHERNVIRNQAEVVFLGAANDSGMDFVIYVTPAGKFFAFTESDLTEMACLVVGGSNPVSIPMGDPA